MKGYHDFLKEKSIEDVPTGILADDLGAYLFDFQADIVRWALSRGRAAIFADCGMGKTVMQLEYAQKLGGPALIFAPLAVSLQTLQEGAKFGIEVRYEKRQPARLGKHDIIITNYERIENFKLDRFKGIILDESSILKSYDGKTRTKIIQESQSVPFRLACTATPAPNDFMELGNHSEFLGILKYQEMLSMFFVHDGGETQKWRLKGHAQQDFWRWLCSWAVMLRKPSDLHYPDGDFILPSLNYHNHVVETEAGNYLFPMEAQTLQERIRERACSVGERVKEAASIVNKTDGLWLVWCNLNKESGALARAIPGAVEVRGSDSVQRKEKALLDFARGKIRVLISKPTIAGHGMNFQKCNQMAFVGLSDSWEQWYQAVRRCWRFGQTKDVDVHVIYADTEGAVVKNIKRKEEDANRMALEMVEHMHVMNEEALHGKDRTRRSDYARDEKNGAGWQAYLGDCVDILREKFDDCSIGYSVFSPPFSSLYTYSDSERDMGNCRDNAEFNEHFKYLAAELFRVIANGRLVSIHCMDLPTSKTHHGYIGLKDFRGDLIRMMENFGFIWHSCVAIWKDPVTAMQRTKALGLLHKQLKKDSTMSRQGIPDYVCTFRKPGENEKPVAHTNETFPVSVWQKWASPIWDDIDPSDTLQFRSAREHKDEKHIAPLQLEVIRRCIGLWSSPGDVVLSPFAGIGSEGYVALQMGREFKGVELKHSYWLQMVKNLSVAKEEAGELFAERK